MTRRIQLPLGTTTTETRCGNCLGRVRLLEACGRFGEMLTFEADGWVRAAKCRAAEVKEVGDA